MLRSVEGRGLSSLRHFCFRLIVTCCNLCLDKCPLSNDPSIHTPPTYGPWSCLCRLRADGQADDVRAAIQDSVNPKFIPRQHLLHYAIKGAEAGDPTELNKLMDVLRRCGGQVWQV